jgi:GNAT superfamily N-acetyltransferase
MVALLRYFQLGVHPRAVEGEAHRRSRCCVAFNSADVTMLEGRRDLAVLWDIRVSPDFRGQGLGSGLLRAAEAWAISKGCLELKVETQNTNVRACRPGGPTLSFRENRPQYSTAA